MTNDQLSWRCFWIICAAVASVLIVRITPLLPIYLDHDLRDRVSTVIQATAVREGWLRSGLSIRHIDSSSVSLFYRSHLRGADPIRCYSISVQTGRLSSCANF